LSVGYRYFRNQNYENDYTTLFFLFFQANILLIEIILVHLRTNQIRIIDETNKSI
jgi:hypothetical protein